jgi:putative nucleotidyltransferase with HDIG domain
MVSFCDVRTHFASMGESPAKGERWVLLVDRDAAARCALRKVLEHGQRPIGVLEARTATEMAEMAGGAQLVLADASPGGPGVGTTVAMLREHHPDMPVIVMSSVNEPNTMRSALDLGALSFIVKAGPPAQVRATVAAALDGNGLLDRDVVAPVTTRYAALLELTRRRDRLVIESLAAVVEAKDAVTSLHLRTVSRLAARLADLVDSSLAASEDFQFGCLLHDVGKIGVPERILGKPGPLTEEEWAVMRRHPQAGASVIRPLGLAPVVEQIVLHHHERWDGSGYPDGLSGDGIPRAARIFSVCDALEAMTAPRPYRREPIPIPEALERVQEEAGTQFDPTVVAALERAVARGELALEELLDSEPAGA